jgi:hypothetical protein
MARNVWACGGFFLGLLGGYPMSYFFQPGALRAKMSMGSYIESAGDVLQHNDLAPTAIGTWIASVIVFTIIGYVLGALTEKKA